MKKRVIALLLTLLMVSASLIGCSSSGGDTDSSK